MFASQLRSVEAAGLSQNGRWVAIKAALELDAERAGGFRRDQLQCGDQCAREVDVWLHRCVGQYRRHLLVPSQACAASLIGW